MFSAKEIRQYAAEVVNYSTEYGRSQSSSYTAGNLAGEPRLSGRYGDFTDAFVLVCNVTNKQTFRAFISYVRW